MPGYFSDYNIDIATDDAPTATAISENVIDLGPVATNTLRCLPGPKQQYVEIFVSESAGASGSATVTFTLESDSTANLATSATVHTSTAAIGKSSLPAGTYVYLDVPAEQTYERYLGVRYTIATGPLTAGKFTVRLVDTKVVGNVLTYANGKLAP
jgi:hypothetical protein